MVRDHDSAEDGKKPLAGLVPVLLHGVWRHRLLVAAAIGIGTAVGLFRGVVTPNQYQSFGKLFVKPGIRDTSALEAEFARGAASARVSSVREAVQNEMQVLSSAALFDKIVARVGVDSVLAPYDPASINTDEVPWHRSLFHGFQTWWFSTAASPPSTDFPVDLAKLASLVLQHSVAIVPEPGASVITFSYVSHSPERARIVVDAALKAAMDLHSEVFMTMASLEKVEAEQKLAESKAIEAERLLREFRLEREIYDFETQRTSEVANLNDLARRLDATQAEIGRKQAEMLQLTTWLGQLSDKKRRPGSMTVNPVWEGLVRQQESLRLDLERLEQEKDYKKESYEKQKPVLEGLLRSIRAELGQVAPTILVEGVMDENADYLAVVQRIAEASVVLKGLEATLKEYGRQRDASQKQLGAIEALLPDLRRYEIDAEQKRSTADTLLREVATQRAVQRLDQLNLSNIGVLHPASLEVTKVAPSRGKMIVVGLFGGALIGLAIAGLLTLLDRRIRIPADLVRLGLPEDGVVAGAASVIVPNARCSLPQSLAGIKDDIARFWTAIPYDRRSSDGLRIAFVPCGDGANVGRAAAALAIGLAVHGGEKVLYLASVEGSTWLAQRLGLPVNIGWGEVLRGEVELESAFVATPIQGLSYLPAGTIGSIVPHPMAVPAFVALLDRATAMFRFVIVEVPDLEQMPAGRSVLGGVDAAELVVCRETSSKSSVQSAMKAVATSGTRLLGAFLQAKKGGEVARVVAADRASGAVK